MRERERARARERERELAREREREKDRTKEPKISLSAVSMASSMAAPHTWAGERGRESDRGRVRLLSLCVFCELIWDGERTLPLSLFCFFFVLFFFFCKLVP